MLQVSRNVKSSCLSESGTVLPGLHDGHVHAILGALNLMQCNVAEAATLEEAREIIKHYVEQNPQSKVVFGSGWKHNWPTLIDGMKETNVLLTCSGAATAAMIDDIVPDKPFLVCAGQLP